LNGHRSCHGVFGATSGSQCSFSSWVLVLWFVE
jgi:hypothetical protein